MKKPVVAAVVIAAAVFAVPIVLKALRGSGGPADAAATARTAAPRFVDVGTTTCIPCRVMLGVMDELRRDYAGSLVVDFVDIAVTPAEADRYGVRAIPTQIFYAPDGRELWRHTGVIRAEAVIAKWAELGFPVEPSGARPTAER
jgi:thioredoxin 1